MRATLSVAPSTAQHFLLLCLHTAISRRRHSFKQVSLKSVAVLAIRTGRSFKNRSHASCMSHRAPKRKYDSMSSASVKELDNPPPLLIAPDEGQVEVPPDPPDTVKRCDNHEQGAGDIAVNGTRDEAVPERDEKTAPELSTAALRHITYVFVQMLLFLITLLLRCGRWWTATDFGRKRCGRATGVSKRKDEQYFTLISPAGCLAHTWQTD